MENSRNSADKFAIRIEKGADAELLALFGYGPDENQEGIDGLRRNVLKSGYFAKNEVDTTNIVGVLDHREEIYPAFQFDPSTKQPRAIVQSVNSLFLDDKDFRNWEIAMWWISPNGYLDGLTPEETLGTSLEDILESVAKEEHDL